jgi:lysophospholipase L1-like esterase
MNKKLFYTVTTLLGITIIYFILKKYIPKNMKFSNSLKSILFVGDSITAIEYNGKPVTSTYPNIVKKELEPKGIKVDVVAKGGRRTDWILDNLTEKLKKNTYDRVYIYGGVNDMFSSTTIKEALNNIQKMVDLVNSKGGKAFVITGYDTRIFMEDDKLVPTKYVPTKAGMIKLKNRYIEFQDSIASSIKNATIIPKFNISSKYTSDGVHPSGTGQKMIAESLLEDLRKNV